MLARDVDNIFNRICIPFMLLWIDVLWVCAARSTKVDNRDQHQDLPSSETICLAPTDLAVARAYSVGMLVPFLS